MYGTDGEHEFVWEGRKGAYRYRDRFEGAVPRLEWLEPVDQPRPWRTSRRLSWIGSTGIC